ncbi:MAG: hypothetical protein KAJ19_09985, partial [Gammaproteobacteria bacterium]|nr:hypothetical protein [Gammaproteobacteria bacterium]
EDHVPTPVIHIPIEDHVPTPVIHVPFEDHAPTPVIHIEEEDLPDIHIPVEALAGWRRYANWLPLLSLLAREKDIMDLT